MSIICPTCLHPNPPSTVLCQLCGRTLSNIEKCPACGATVFAFSQFCYQCGVLVKPPGTPPRSGEESTTDLDTSTGNLLTGNLLTGDFLAQGGDDSPATTFHRHGVRLLHRPSSVFYDLPLLASPITIGKRSDTFTPDLDLKDLPESEFVSRNHAQISFSPQKFYIEDLGSKNGTALNGVPLPAEQPQPLAFGDQLCFGGAEALTFIFIQDQPINLAHLRTLSGQDQGFEVELLNSYLESVSQLLQTLQRCLQERRFAEAKPIASQIAIASYNVGADVMNLLAKQLEDQAQQSAPICEKTFQSLQEGLSQIRQFVKVVYGSS